MLLHVKDTVSLDFRPFFKNSSSASYKQAKMVLQQFLFLQRYSQKMCVHVVKDNADIMSAKTMTTLTRK